MHARKTEDARSSGCWQLYNQYPETKRFDYNFAFNLTSSLDLLFGMPPSTDPWEPSDILNGCTPLGPYEGRLYCVMMIQQRKEAGSHKKCVII